MAWRIAFRDTEDIQQGESGPRCLQREKIMAQNLQGKKVAILATKGFEEVETKRLGSTRIEPPARTGDSRTSGFALAIKPHQR
jgi:hypothetical protein